MDQSLDNKSEECEYFKDNTEQNVLMICVENEDVRKDISEYYKSNPCYKRNPHVDEDGYCKKEQCLYYKPEVSLAVDGIGRVIVYEKEDLLAKEKELEDIPLTTPEKKEEHKFDFD